MLREPRARGAAWVGPARVRGIAAATPSCSPRGPPDSWLPWTPLPPPSRLLAQGPAHLAAGRGTPRAGRRGAPGRSGAALAHAPGPGAAQLPRPQLALLGARPCASLLNRLGGGASDGGRPRPCRPRPQLHFWFLFPRWRPARTASALFPSLVDPPAGPSARLFAPAPAPASRGALAPTLRLPATSRTSPSDLATPILPRYLRFHFLPPGPLGTRPDTPSSAPAVSTPAGGRALSSPPLQPDPPRRPQKVSPTLSLTPPVDPLLAPAPPAVDALSRPPCCPEAPAGRGL